MKHNTWISGLMAVSILGFAGTGLAQNDIERVEPAKLQAGKAEAKENLSAKKDEVRTQSQMKDQASTKSQSMDQTQTRARKDANAGQTQAKDQTRATTRLRQELKSQSQSGGDAVRERRQGGGKASLATRLVPARAKGRGRAAEPRRINVNTR